MGNKISNSNYITIQGFMINDLDLKGNELIIYACIYGFSQAENQVFNGGLQYLAEWTNSTKQSVLKCLKSLIDKGFIGKYEKIINGIKVNEYYSTRIDEGVNKVEYHSKKFNEGVNKVEYPIKQSLTGIKQSLTGIKQSLPNNIIYNNNNNNNNNNNISDDNFLKILSLVSKELQEPLKAFISMRKKLKKPLTPYALDLAIKKLNRLSSDEKVKIQIIEQSIEKCYLAFYPLKDNFINFENEQKRREDAQAIKAFCDQFNV